MDNQFLGLEGPACDPETSPVVVLPLPLEKTTTYRKGTALAPAALVEASLQVEFFDPEVGREVCKGGIHTDWSLGNPSWNEAPMEELLGRIRERVTYWVERDKFILSLGGEHTITVGTIDPYLERLGSSLTVVHIDAHADLKDEYAGSRYNHACVMRRLLGRVPIVSVGVRAVDAEEYKVATGSGIDVFYMHELRRLSAWVDPVLQKVRTENVYLTVDLDGLDPAVIPSVGTPQPGGLLWDETLQFLRELGRRHRIVGADVNEFCPGPVPYADYNAAALCYKILAYR